MLNTEALANIARTGIVDHWAKYVVILDNTDRNQRSDVSAADYKASDYTVIYTGNNYDKAVEITNFWDERQNVHLVVNNVEKIRTELEVIEALVENDLTIPADHEMFNKFAALTVSDTVNVMTRAAGNRLHRK